MAVPSSLLSIYTSSDLFSVTELTFFGFVRRPTVSLNANNNNNDNNERERQLYMTKIVSNNCITDLHLLFLLTETG